MNHYLETRRKPMPEVDAKPLKVDAKPLKVDGHQIKIWKFSERFLK